MRWGEMSTTGVIADMAWCGARWRGTRDRGAWQNRGSRTPNGLMGSLCCWMGRWVGGGGWDGVGADWSVCTKLG